MEGKILRYKGKDFTMEPYIKIIAVGDFKAFVKVLYPKCWGINPKLSEAVFSLEKIEGQYQEVDSYDNKFYE